VARVGQLWRDLRDLRDLRDALDASERLRASDKERPAFLAFEIGRSWSSNAPRAALGSRNSTPKAEPGAT